jgi:hypothetical protein
LVFAVAEVPAGTYDKIRLQVSDLVLHDLDAAQSQPVQLVGNGKIDLNPQGPFTVGEDEVIVVELDFDMAKSIKLTETGSGNLILRPVVFVDIQTERATSRLTRMRGRIENINLDLDEFELCQTGFVAGEGDPQGERCVIVGVDDDTVIFDPDGEPQDLDDLDVGDEVTVIGRLHPLGAEDFAFLFDAFVVEEGEFLRIRGTIASEIDASERFDPDVAANQDVPDDVPLAVQLFPETRILDARGEDLEREDIVEGQGAIVDGVVDEAGDGSLNTSLVIVTGADDEEAELRGMIASIDAGATSLVVTDDETGDRCVVATGADVFLVDESDGVVTTPIVFDDLEAGQRVAVFGTEEIDGCLAAETIFADL